MRLVLALVLSVMLSPGVSIAHAADIAAAEAELRDIEQAFADTMAARDLAAFRSFLDPETVWGGGERVLRGADAVAEAWSRYFEGEQAPFSWRPERVTVLASGDLGMTSGPVFDPGGKRIGTFNSVWRRDAEGRFRVVFDRGCPSLCPDEDAEKKTGSDDS